MTDSPLTSQLSDFSPEELDKLIALIQAIKIHGLPKDYSNQFLVFMVNKQNSHVFISNADYQYLELDTKGNLVDFKLIDRLLRAPEIAKIEQGIVATNSKTVH